MLNLLLTTGLRCVEVRQFWPSPSSSLLLSLFVCTLQCHVFEKRLPFLQLSTIWKHLFRVWLFGTTYRFTFRHCQTTFCVNPFNSSIPQPPTHLFLGHKLNLATPPGTTDTNLAGPQSSQNYVYIHSVTTTFKDFIHSYQNLPDCVSCHQRHHSHY